MMTNYRRGVDIERKRMKLHKDNGAAIVLRTAGSHSKIDVGALYIDELPAAIPDFTEKGEAIGTIIFEQCKRSKTGDFPEPQPPFPDGYYWVQFNQVNWLDRKGYQDGKDKSKSSRTNRTRR